MSYLRDFSTLQTPQSEPVPGSSQVKNDAGGYAWQVDKWARLDRFLALGSEGGTYYVGQRELTRENAENTIACIAEDGIRAVDRIVEISQSGRAPKNDPALFALALAAAASDPETRGYALHGLPKVARTGTHLLIFASYVENFRGWGRSLRRAVAAWYLDRQPQPLAYQVTKYPQRNGWSQRDLLRLSHPKVAEHSAHDMIFQYVTGGKINSYAAIINGVYASYLHAVETAKQSTDALEVIPLIFDHKLTREQINPALLSDEKVWAALLADMPLTAMIRNLGNMTKVGTLKPMSATTKIVIDRLRDEERIQKARIHPLSALVAMNVYRSGSGFRGSGSWEPISQIVDALNDTFYLAFKFIEPANRKTLLALDVSGSMNWGEIAEMPGVTPMIGAAAMAMATARTEPEHHFTAFSHEMVPLSISSSMNLTEVFRAMQGIPFGGTDCSLPIRYALRQGIEVETFVVYTDNQTWAGPVHPSQALREYRERTGINAKLVVVGMTAERVSIADPDDAGMLDVVGFDTAAPGIISDFSRG